MWRDWNLYILPVGMLNGSPALENSMTVPQKVKHGVTIWPGISFLGIYPRKWKTYVHTKTCTWMFITALFTTVKK